MTGGTAGTDASGVAAPLSFGSTLDGSIGSIGGGPPAGGAGALGPLGGGAAGGEGGALAPASA